MDFPQHGYIYYKWNTMGNKNKQNEEVISATVLSEAEILEIESLQPTNMLIKVSLSKDLKFLSNEDRAAIFTNMFNYHTGTELVEMTGIAQMFFSRLEEVFEYNIYNYQEVVKKNRINGKKGGRPQKKTQNNPTVISVTHQNPLDILENPNNLKDKDKAKDKDIENDKGKDKATDRANAIENENVKENEKNRIMQFKEKFRKVVDIDFRNIKDLESKHFCYNVIELKDKIDWARFDVLIFGTSKKEVPVILAEYEIPSLEPVVTSIRRDYSYFLNKLIN